MASANGCHPPGTDESVPRETSPTRAIFPAA